MSSKTLSTPKRSNVQPNNRLAWYDYYAGYSPQFAVDIIRKLNASSGSVILDPWNGIGMTTHAASAAGCKAVGSDLNPATVIIAKALSISVGDKSSILPLQHEIITKSFKVSKLNGVEPLEIWFEPEAAFVIRSLEKAIQYCLVRENKKDYEPVYVNVEPVSEIASFFYLALFKVVRKLIQKFTGSNPTWIKKPKRDSDKLNYSRTDIIKFFKEEVQSMLDVFAPVFPITSANRAELSVGNSTSIKCGDDTIDFVITSPPYCTRIDYAVSTMPELAVLGIHNDDFIGLRKRLIGSTTVPKTLPKISPDWGMKCNMFLTKLRNHSSKASATYYLKNHVQYFDLMNKSLYEIGRVLKNKGTCVLVVQDSYYKEIHTDLPSIIVDMAYNAGMYAEHILGFTAFNNMAELNPGSKKYRSASPATESVLFFKNIK